MTSDLMVGVAALGTAVAAIWGLWKWRSELKGKVQFDAARNLAKATYSLRNAVERARSRYIDGREFPDDFHSNPAAPASDRARAYEQVFARRWEPVWEALDAFDAATLEAEVFWGEEGLRAAAEAMRRAVRELQAATDAFVSNEAVGGEDFKQDRDFGKLIRSTVFGNPGDSENDFAAKMGDAVEDIEKQLRPYLLR